MNKQVCSGCGVHDCPCTGRFDAMKVRAERAEAERDALIEKYSTWHPTTVHDCCSKLQETVAERDELQKRVDEFTIYSNELYEALSDYDREDEDE